MIDVGLLWWLLLPVVLSAATFLGYRRFVDSDLVHAGLLSLGGLIVSSAIMCAFWYGGKSMKTSDVELWNGEITSKSREHGHYQRSYECNCTETCSGSGSNRSCTRTCQTCYEDHYTVTWAAQSNVGSWVIQHYDELSKRVYNSPDPHRYTIIQKGDPACRQNSYTNWIKGSPRSLFAPAAADLKAKFAKQIPPYPSHVFDFYKANRVLSVGVPIDNPQLWNDTLSLALRKLGPQKQANVVILFVNTPDENYYYALQDAWLNGKKNDIVVIVGTTALNRKPDWVRIMSWAEHDIFNVKLRDSLLEFESFTPETTIGKISEVTMSDFKRRSMKQFQYLEAEIAPSDDMIAAAVASILIAYIACWMFIRIQFPTGFNGSDRPIQYSRSSYRSRY